LRPPKGITLARGLSGLEALLAPWRGRRGGLGLVPTMGALHAGHLSLVEQSRLRCARTLVSIFVNPTQFGPGEDFGRYPRTLAADLRLLAGQGPLVVLAPSAAEVYPAGHATRVSVDSPLTQVLEGAHRPGHFAGVATVVAKLFCLAGPCTAFFGEKDWQQLQVIRRMAQDLRLPVGIVGCPIVREADGLALSSRNAYLSPAERGSAPRLKASLDLALARLKAGDSGPAACRKARAFLEKGGQLKAGYLVLADAETLEAPQKGKPRRLLASAQLGKTRLIDNIAA
jgi:pantoate--beta-alanine ligase